uniref:Coiled-coil and C2 domain-containing protein 1B n=1 Tax=Salvator merianae TaxID=96440 RepID=A0A8D0DY98_SALMN
MLGRRPRKSPQVKGHEAAKQLGLFVEFSPEEMMLDMEDDGDLEAELAAITGEDLSAGKTKPKGKSPLPMDHIEKMAAECMKDVDDDDDEGLEEDTELLNTCHLCCLILFSPLLGYEMSPVSSALQQKIEERIANYKMAILNAKESGESAKVRRYERGFKALETMLTAVKKGKPVKEEEMPPPVASGKTSGTTANAVHNNLPQSSDNQDDITVPEEEERQSSSVDQEAKEPRDYELPVNEEADRPIMEVATMSENDANTRALLVSREKEYKLAALKAKQRGDLEKAKEYMRTGKKFTMVLEALDSGQLVDLRDMPPAPQEKVIMISTQLNRFNFFKGSLQQPTTVLEALQQRLEKYKAAAAQAKANGDDRKSRMHERIAKQYQDAIRACKAGRKVNFAELPVPPGFPPIPGMASAGDGTVVAALENASRLVKMEEEEEEDDKEDDGEGEVYKKVFLRIPCFLFAAREHIEFLEGRKKQYVKAAIQAKKKNDLEQAKLYLRTAKSLDPKIELAKSGKLVDISKLPSPPTDDDSDFIFIHHEDVRLSQKAEDVYLQLIKLLQDQHEKCLLYSKQFMHLGNVSETSRFEKLAQNCKKDLDILQLAQAQGLDPPSHHFEERTFKIVRIFSELSSTEMHLIIVRGINLPAPPGVAPNDLDAFVKFEFHYPNTEQAQKNKTSVIKNTNCPEYDQLFKLNINRNHRGFRRAIQTKGIKFEVFHKGSFFRSDKQVGTAHLKLDKLEYECEIREIIEVLDSRKPTGGKLEVKVRLREPLSGQDFQTVTENWLILEH